MDFVSSESRYSYVCVNCNHKLTTKEYDRDMCLVCGAFLSLHNPKVIDNRTGKEVI